jgi:hypothetical protein
MQSEDDFVREIEDYGTGNEKDEWWLHRESKKYYLYVHNATIVILNT